jgi:isopenicillin N synthase-like dioxygenase
MDECVQACIDVGFFYVINHGVDVKLLDEVFEQSKRFFALPIEEKMKVIHDENHRGYTPFQEQFLDPAKQSKGTIQLKLINVPGGFSVSKPIATGYMLTSFGFLFLM